MLPCRDILTLASYQVQGTCICLEVKWKDYTCFSDQGKLTHCKNKIVTFNTNTLLLDAQCKHCVMYSTIGLRSRDVYLPEYPTYKQQLH